MYEFASYMWSVVDWRTDQMYLLLDNRAKGIYRELIDECWINGSIPSDPSLLSTLCRETLDDFLPVWAVIEKRFQLVFKNGNLSSDRLEEDRHRLMRIRRQRQFAANRSVEARRQRLVDRQVSNIRSTSVRAKPNQTHAQTQTSREEGSLFKDSPKVIHNSSRIVSPSIDGRDDPAAEYFKAQCMELTQTAYVFKRGDFVQLTALRKAFSIGTKEDLPGWPEAVTNYFASPLSQNSIADLCCRYSVFRNSRLDGYNKPVNHVNRNDRREGGNRRVGRSHEAAQAARDRLHGNAGDRDERRTESAANPDLPTRSRKTH